MRLLFSGLSVALLSTMVQPLPAVVTFDAPGHVYTDKETPVARGGGAGAKFSIIDWRGRPTGHGGTFNADGKAEINQDVCVKCGTCVGACPVNAITE